MAGAQYFAMTPDEEEEAPAASRPAPVEEVQPLGRDGRHCGSGFELVLDARVPQLGREVVEVQQIDILQGIVDLCRARDPGKGGGEGQVTDQEIPEVQVPRRRRVQQRTVRFEDVSVPLVSQERISERIQEQIVDAWESQGIPDERIPERIAEQIVPVPQVSRQERIPERIHEQTVDVPSQVIPQERISERIVEQVPARQVIPQTRIPERIMEPIVDTGMGTSSSSAAALGDAEPKIRGFSHFSPKEKSAKIDRELTAGVIGQSSSWPPAAYAVPMVSEVAAPVLEVDSVDEDPIYWRDELGRLWERSAYNPRKWHLYLDADIVWEEPG